MIRKIYNKLRWLPSNIVNTIEFKLRGVVISKSAIIRGRVFIRGKGKLLIGDNSIINSSKEANPIGGDTQSTFFIKENGTLSIGNNVGISNSAFVVRREVVIEDDVMIGSNCKIYDNDFHSLDYRKRVSHEENDVDISTKEIKIEEGVFIGAHSIILKGVTIGKYSIVGAGSVVTKDIPEYEIWGGNPAKFIRRIEYHD